MRSYLPDFDLVQAATLKNALEFLGSGWRPIAGGTDLMVLFNSGKLPFHRLVSVRRLPELRDTYSTGDYIVLGGSSTYTQIRQSDLLAREFPLLSAAASWTGGIANQNRGTLAGNIVNASPAADSVPPLLVYDAELELVSTSGERIVPIREFYTGYKQMQLRTDELLKRIRLPRKYADWRHYCRKVGARKAQAIAKVCVAGMAKMRGDVIEDVRLAIGSVAPIPFTCRHTESTLRGQIVSKQLRSQAEEVLKNEIAPIDDIRSTREYRIEVSARLLQEFLETLTCGSRN